MISIKELKVTWWSGHSATSSNWTVNWFGGWRLLWHFNSLGTALRFLGTCRFSRFLKWWYLQRGTGIRRTDSRFGDGQTLWKVSLIWHAGSLLLLRCLLFLLKIFPSSDLTSYDLTSTCCSTRALNHLPDPSVGFTCRISPLPRGGSSLALIL